MRFSQLTRFRMGTLLVTIALIAAACGSDDNDAGADLITQTDTVADASVVTEQIAKRSRSAVDLQRPGRR